MQTLSLQRFAALAELYRQHDNALALAAHFRHLSPAIAADALTEAGRTRRAIALLRHAVSQPR